MRVISNLPRTFKRPVVVDGDPDQVVYELKQMLKRLKERAPHPTLSRPLRALDLHKASTEEKKLKDEDAGLHGRIFRARKRIQYAKQQFVSANRNFNKHDDKAIWWDAGCRMLEALELQRHSESELRVLESSLDDMKSAGLA